MRAGVLFGWVSARANDAGAALLHAASWYPDAKSFKVRADVVTVIPGVKGAASGVDSKELESVAMRKVGWPISNQPGMRVRVARQLCPSEPASAGVCAAITILQ